MQRFFAPFVGGPGAAGLLILRVIVGSGLALHGWTKVFRNGEFVMFNWMGPGAPVPGFFQFLAAFSEFFGGLALVIGLLTPIAAFGILCTMLVAAFMAHGGDPLIANNRAGQPYNPSKEPALLYATTAFLLMLTGPGKLSLDALLFGRKSGRVLAERPASSPQTT